MRRHVDETVTKRDIKSVTDAVSSADNGCLMLFFYLFFAYMLIQIEDAIVDLKPEPVPHFLERPED